MIRRTGKIFLGALLSVALVVPVLTGPACGPASGRLSGLCFSPFLSADAEEAGPLEELIDEVAPYTAGIRTFGSTGAWAEIPEMAKDRGLYMAAGAGLNDDGEYSDGQIAGIIELAKTGTVDLAVVGDENLMWDTVDEEDLISYIRRVKKTGVPTTTSDGWIEMLEHPKVMDEVDVVVINVYPFAEGLSVSRAMDYLDSAYGKVKAKAGNKEVIVETGWPSAGESHRNAVPGAENAARYLSEFISWAEAEGVRYFYFEAFDEPWKVEKEGSVGEHWGLWDRYGRMKPYTRSVLQEDR